MLTSNLFIHWQDPYLGKVVSVKRIVGPKATGETCDIVIETGKDLPYWEGQSFGVIPPGTNPKNGKPNSVRLYSIAASRYGDDMTGKTTTLCVRRATYWDEEMGAEDPAKKVRARHCLRLIFEVLLPLSSCYPREITERMENYLYMRYV